MAVIPVEAISHVGIRVHDLERSMKFYRLLGFELVAGPIGPEPVAILDHPSGIEINLVLNAKEPDAENVLMDVAEKKPGYTHIALVCFDLPGAEALLVANGYPISGRMTFPDGNGGALFVRDPDRNVVELNDRRPRDAQPTRG